MQCVSFVVIKSADIPKDAVDSTETLQTNERITDKIDDMTDETDDTNEDDNSDAVIKFIGDVMNRAQSFTNT